MNDEGWVLCPLCDQRTPDMGKMARHLLDKHKGGDGLPPELYGLVKSGNIVCCWCANRFYYKTAATILHDDWVVHLEQEGGPTAHLLSLILKE